MRRAERLRNAVMPVNVKTCALLSIATSFRKAVTGDPKVLVPCFRETGNDLLSSLSCNFHAGMYDISPGVHASSFVGKFLKTYPLRENDPQ